MMKKSLLAVLVGMIIVMTAACTANTEAPAEEKKETAAAAAETTAAVTEAATEAASEAATEAAVETAAEEELEVLDTMKISIHKILDRSNVIVRFNLDLIGYTDTPNYTITDESGKEMELVSANSAFWDLGGEVTNVFKLVFSEPLEPGKYNVKIQNIVDAIGDPHHNFLPAECELVITEDVPVSAE